MWVKGSGSDLATMERRHVTGLRLEEMLPLMAREAMSDEEMVAYLARCQIDPAMPRCSIETLLHAFVPAAHVHHTHPGRHQRPGGRRRRREPGGGVLRRRAAWIPYIRPGFTLSRQVGEAVRADPGLELSCWPSTAWSSGATRPRPPIGARSRSSTRRSTSSTRARRDGRASEGRPAPRLRRRRRRCSRRCCPPCAGRSRAIAPRCCRVDASPRVLEFVASAAAPELVEVGAPCPDHLVHTKRLPLWVPFDPASDDAAALASASRELAAGVPRRLPRLRRAVRRRGRRCRPTPTRGSCSSRTSGSSRSGRRPRPPACRATSTTARSR